MISGNKLRALSLSSRGDLKVKKSAFNNMYFYYKAIELVRDIVTVSLWILVLLVSLFMGMCGFMI